MSEAKTLSPDSGLSPDISLADLGKLLGGEELLTAPVIPEPAAPVIPEPTEAVAAEPAAAEPVTPVEGEGTPEPIQEPKPEEKESGVDKRLRQLGQKRREAEARADQATARAEQFQRELEALKAQPGPKTPAAEAPAATADPKPTLKDFVAKLAEGEEYDQAVERYTDASSDWRDRQRSAERDKQTAADSQKTQQQLFAKDWQAALEVHPDFEDVVSRVRSIAPEGLQIAVSQLRQDDGEAQWPAVTMYLDEHPEELKALSVQFAANPYAATAKLGRIAAALGGAAAPPAAPKPAAQTPPTPPKLAPKPPGVVGGTAAPSIVELDKADMNTFAREMTQAGL